MAAKEKQPACALTEGCIKRGGHEKSRHAGEAKCSTYEQAYPDDGGEGPPGPKVPALAARIPDAEAAPEASAGPVVRARKKPERVPLPTDPAKWKAEHSLQVLGRIERAFALVPMKRRGAFRLLVAESLGQVDIEETAVKS